MIHALLCLITFTGTFLGPYYASGNFATNLMGPPDTRPETYGNADVQRWPVKFSVPAGYHRVRILAIRGDLVAMPRALPEDPQVPVGRSVGLLLGFGTTAQEGSVRCNPCADNTMLYVQTAMSVEPVTRSFDYRIRGGALLDPDNTLIVTLASWLNTTGVAVHAEATYTITYQFEK